MRPVMLILPFFIVCSSFSGTFLSPMDQTSNWSFPYSASSDRITQIESAIKAISLPIKYAEVVAKLGPPDLVNDTKHNFLILSPVEDNFLIANRSKVFWRSVWFVSRASRMPNLLDQWYSVYLGSDGQTVLRVLKNNIGPPSILTNYGRSGIGYGTGNHPGIDYAVPIGTPIVAVSDGTVIYMGKRFEDKWYGGGYGVGVKHGDQFFSVYAHLSEVVVVIGQQLKRGQLIGFSGKSNNHISHLHFGLINSDKKGNGLDFNRSYDPNKFWLEGSPQCFDPNKDYSGYSFKDITLPVACNEYQRKLLLEREKQKP